jgi:hypothetical protein
MRPDTGRREYDAVGPHLGNRERLAPLRNAHQFSHAFLDVPVEALLRPPAEEPETQPDDRVLDRGGTGVSRDAERHLARA